MAYIYLFIYGFTHWKLIKNLERFDWEIFDLIDFNREVGAVKINQNCYQFISLNPDFLLVHIVERFLDALK